MAKRPTEIKEYKVGDWVLGFHGDLLYKAKVLKKKDGPTPALHQYFVHYLKWSRRWDEWVQPGRLMPFTDENAELAKKLAEEYREQKKRSKSQSSSASSSSGGDDDSAAGGGGKRRRKEEVPEDVTDKEVRCTLQFKLPATLKSKLVDDWTQVARKHCLISLPASPTVRELLNEYVEAKSRKSSNVRAVEDLVTGILVYFDRALPTVLLYRYERPQYKREKDKAGGQLVPSDVYGGEHLMRLFIKLPGLLSHSMLKAKQTALLQRNLSDFLAWAQRHKGAFSGTYVRPADEDEYNAEYEKANASRAALKRKRNNANKA